MKVKIFLSIVMFLALVLAGMVNVPGSATYAAKPKPRTNAWAKTGSMQADRYMHTATLLLNRKVLVAGGINNSQTTATAELYNPTTGKWSKTGSMSARRVNFTATLLHNGKVLVAGGAADNSGNGNALATAELYNPTTGKWSKTGSMSTSRYIHTATLLPNGQVLVVGGTEDNHTDGDGLDTAELYNPTTGKWSTTGSMASSRVDFTATLLPDGKVLVAGGWDNSGDGSGNALATAELYNPTDGTWSTTGSMTSNRVDFTATLLPDGKVLVASGDAAGTAELYNPTDGTWSTTDSMTMSTSRYKHTATLLPNGKVLVAGGAADNSGGDALNTAELYNPTDGTWSTTDPMFTGRLSHTETLLPNKKVLVVGGWNVDSLAKAELFSAPN
jgi:N-acetylneuraminic acid mutarotase